MKTLLILFVLFFSSSVVAEDISDFQIEGMSVGDSLLDYFTEEEIRNNIIEQYQYYEDQSFTTVEFHRLSFLKTYDGVQFHIKRNDKNYKIYDVRGATFYDKNIDQCYIKLRKISKELTLKFKNVEKVGPDKQIHLADPTGQSTYTGIYFWFESGDVAAVECYDWSINVNYTDNLRVILSTKEFSDWLDQ